MHPNDNYNQYKYVGKTIFVRGIRFVFNFIRNVAEIILII